MFIKLNFPVFLSCIVLSLGSVCPEIEDEVLEYSLNDFDQADPKLIEVLQQQQYLIKPNGKSLNLTNPISAQNLGGQYGQPFFLDEKYFKGKKKKGFFIEAGAYDGESISNSLFFEVKYQWTGLLIEPNQWFNKRLADRNRNTWSFNFCLSTKTHPEVVTFAHGGSQSGIVNEETGVSPLKPTYKLCNATIKKQCFPLYSLLLAVGNPRVDYFSLDVEGSELDILRTIPWKKVNIRSVSVEANHLGEVFPGTLTDLDDLMFSNGFELLGMVEIDRFYVKKKNNRKQPKAEL